MPHRSVTHIRTDVREAETSDQAAACAAKRPNDEQRGHLLVHGHLFADQIQHCGQGRFGAAQIAASNSLEASFWPRSTSDR